MIHFLFVEIFVIHFLFVEIFMIRMLIGRGTRSRNSDSLDLIMRR